MKRKQFLIGDWRLAIDDLRKSLRSIIIFINIERYSSIFQTVLFNQQSPINNQQCL